MSSRSTRTGIALGSLLVVAGAGAWLALQGNPFSPPAETHWSMVDRYCTDCHNPLDRDGGIAFDGLSADGVAADPGKFERAVRKLRGRLMPPPGNPQPTQTDIDDFVAWVENTIDTQATGPVAGHVPVQRMTRTEYALAVEDLVGVTIDPEEHLPTEIEVDGFTNVAAALSVSPAFLEQYIGVARKVARLAIGEPEPKLASAYFPPPEGDQDGYAAGMPPGTRGGVRFAHNFPADGEYRINITDLDVGLYPRAIETEQTLVVLLDRREVFRETLGGPADLALVDLGGAPARAEIMERFSGIPLQVPAGVHEIVVTFIERSRAATDGIIHGFTPYGGFSFRGQMRVPRVIGGVEVVGPFESSGLSMTASREKIFVCRPPEAGSAAAPSVVAAAAPAAASASPPGGAADPAAGATQSRRAPSAARDCAGEIAATLARRAYRRPVGTEDLERLMTFFDAGYAEASSTAAAFDTGIGHMLTAVLASPDFLYRSIEPPADAVHGATEGDFELSELALASRLAYFVWSRPPDDELLSLAESGRLSQANVLDAQVERMLADPRARALVTGFALAWLNLDELDAVDPDNALFPDFEDELRTDFSIEIELFLASVLLGDADIRSLLTADHTFVNERLAAHYGLDAVRGAQFRRVTLTDDNRFGLLGKGAMLLRTSYGDRTSPVLRGAWVLEKLLGTPPAPPPPNVETDLSTPDGEQPKTIRVRLEQHREDQSCNGCHGVIDPYGLALENFDVTGRWRDVDRLADAPIDASTALPGGRQISGPVALREALLARPDQFVQALTEKLLMYAVGRELEYHDMPQVRAIVRAAAADDYRFASLVRGVVASDAFRRQAPDDAERGDDG